MCNFTKVSPIVPPTLNAAITRTTIGSELDSEMYTSSRTIMPHVLPSSFLGTTQSTVKAAAVLPIIDVTRVQQSDEPNERQNKLLASELGRRLEVEQTDGPDERQNKMATSELGRRLEEEQCLNNLNYRYDGNDAKSCQWIRNRGDTNRQRLCQDSNVVANCPESCGCCCDDDDNFTFTNHIKSREIVRT